MHWRGILSSRKQLCDNVLHVDFKYQAQPLKSSMDYVVLCKAAIMYRPNSLTFVCHSHSRQRFQSTFNVEYVF